MGDYLSFQVTGIFRGGSATLLRECAGNAVFFTVYEYLRYHIHSRLEGSKLKDGYLVDMGIGVLTGGLGGIAVSKRGLFFFFVCVFHK